MLVFSRHGSNMSQTLLEVSKSPHCTVGLHYYIIYNLSDLSDLLQVFLPLKTYRMNMGNVFEIILMH